MEVREYIEEIDLQRYWLVLRRRWLPATVVLFGILGGSAFYAVTRPVSYEAVGKLLFQRISATPSLTGVGGTLGELEPISIQNNPLDTQAVILRSDQLVDKVIQELNLRNDEGELMPVMSVKRQLSVEGVTGTEVLMVRYTSSDPAQAASIVNRLMELYIAYDKRTNQAEATAAREFVEKALPAARQAVEEAAEDLRRFKEANGIVELQAEAISSVDAMANLNTQIDRAQADLADLETRTVELVNQLNMSSETAVDYSALSQSQGVQQALSNLQTIQSDLANQRARYTSRHPAVVNLELQEAAARRILESRVNEVLGETADPSLGQLQMGELRMTLTADLVRAEAERAGLASEINTLIAAREQYMRWNEIFPDIERQQQLLERRLSAAQTAYDLLLGRQQEVQLAENQTVSNADILDTAIVPQDSVSKSKKSYVMAGAVIGIPLAVMVAFLLDLLDRSIKTAKDAEGFFGYPLLGLIPKYRLDRHSDRHTDFGFPSPTFLLTSGQLPMTTDSYQMLQANLRFLSSDTRLKTIVVTSSVIGEGKSSVSAHLALTISQAGHKVLLIDGDMRASAQHHLWDVVNGIGFSHVLVGEGELEDALQSVTPNLTLMTAGVRPPNPLALIDSQRMVSLLQELRSQFDFILIDTPPLLGGADAAILGNLVDGVLMVVRPRLVDSASGAAAKSMLERSGANMLGIVANGVDIRNEHDDYVSQFKVGGQYSYGQRKELKPASVE